MPHALSPLPATAAPRRGQTIAQKIIARHASREHVEVGEYVNCVPDHVVTQELYWPTHKSNLDKIGATRLARPDKAIIVIDHTPSAAVGSAHAATHRLLKDLTAKLGVENFFGPNTGLRHLVLVERGFARPGSLIFSDEGNIASIGAVGALNIPTSADILVPLLKDENWVRVPKTVRINLHGKLQPGVSARDVVQSIIRDYGAGEFLQCCVEYGGPGLQHLTLDDRQTILASTFHTMSDTAIMDVDALALEYVKERANGRDYACVSSDPDAQFEQVIELDMSHLTPLVTVPPELTGATDVTTLAGTRVHQATIGSCAGNRLQDMRDAATILKGRTIARDVTMYISPGSQNVYAQAAREGLLEIFAMAGATVLSPGCNTCWGYLGVLSEGENSISTHQFNYQGRNGAESAQIYLGSPMTVAASAVRGEITDPRKLLASDPMAACAAEAD
ncbi:3-isopropylmalate dehydratase large subunit [Ottowia thiooxydans]|uniref:3-isopropylmalate dehydratase large subunit n=1 Tax=Ottowia thiooxydans TaxID=219182 RepID=UPI0003FAD25F|nr:aconitase family protein [Ottowia thiooxydans]